MKFDDVRIAEDRSALRSIKKSSRDHCLIFQSRDAYMRRNVVADIGRLVRLPREIEAQAELPRLLQHGADRLVGGSDRRPFIDQHGPRTAFVRRQVLARECGLLDLDHQQCADCKFANNDSLKK